MNRNTLRFHSQRPLSVRRDMSGVPCKAVAEKVRYHVEERYKTDKRSAEREAVRFYLLNHAMADLRQKYELDEPLPPEAVKLVETYYSELNDLAVRMFSYLVLITTRESRHGATPDVLFTKIEEQFGPGARAFNTKIKHCGESASIQTWMNEPPENCTLGQYVDMMSWLFYAPESEYCGGYGGPKWGVIADLVCDYVYGRINAEAMLDTSFTLAHNGGPIFNKGMCFTGYDTASLMAVLDVQASGQIPQLIGEASTYGLAGLMTNDITELLSMAKAALGGAYDENLDWWVVGITAKAPAQYGLSSMKDKQTKKHGPSPMAAEAEKLKAEEEAKAKAAAKAAHAEMLAKAKAQAEKLKAAEEAEALKWFQFGPGDMKVKKVEREAA